MNAVIDEDLPRSFASILSSIGFNPIDVRDNNLRGEPDDNVFKFAQDQGAVLFSGDLGFSNTLNFPLGTHKGICVLRFPNEMTVKEIHKVAKSFLSQIALSDYSGNLIIISPGKIRLRRFKGKH